MHLNSLCNQCMDCLQENKKCRRKISKRKQDVKSRQQNPASKTRRKNRCRYCSQKSGKLHICPEKYIYEFILESFFKRVFLDTQPCSYLDLYQNCITTVAREELFGDCNIIDSILHHYLRYYIQDYEFENFF